MLLIMAKKKKKRINNKNAIVLIKFSLRVYCKNWFLFWFRVTLYTIRFAPEL